MDVPGILVKVSKVMIYRLT